MEPIKKTRGCRGWKPQLLLGVSELHLRKVDGQHAPTGVRLCHLVHDEILLDAGPGPPDPLPPGCPPLVHEVHLRTSLTETH